MTVGIPHRLRLAGALIACAALLAACGSSGKGLIPATDATALQTAFDRLASDVGSNNCSAVSSDLRQADSAASALPITVDAALRRRIADGLADLQQRAPVQCTHSSSSSSSSSSTSSSSSSTTTSSTPTSTSTTTSTTTTTPPPSSTSTSTPPSTTSNTGGGAVAPPPVGQVGGAAQGGNGQ